MKTICSDLLGAYKSWGKSLERAKNALQKFSETGENLDYEKCLEVIKETSIVEEKCKRQFFSRTNFGSDTCVEIERIALEAMQKGNQYTNLKIFSDTVGHRVQTLVIKEVNIFDDTFDHRFSTLLPIFSELKELNCQNHVDKLPQLPVTLTALMCHDCLIDRLPDLPTSLKLLYLRRTKVEDLPDLPDSLIEINIHSTPAESNSSLIHRLEKDFVQAEEEGDYTWIRKCSI